MKKSTKKAETLTPAPIANAETESYDLPLFADNALDMAPDFDLEDFDLDLDDSAFIRESKAAKQVISLSGLIRIIPLQITLFAPTSANRYHAKGAVSSTAAAKALTAFVARAVSPFGTLDLSGVRLMPEGAKNVYANSTGKQAEDVSGHLAFPITFYGLDFSACEMDDAQKMEYLPLDNNAMRARLGQPTLSTPQTPPRVASVSRFFMAACNKALKAAGSKARINHAACNPELAKGEAREITAEMHGLPDLAQAAHAYRTGSFTVA